MQLELEQNFFLPQKTKRLWHEDAVPDDSLLNRVLPLGRHFVQHGGREVGVEGRRHEQAHIMVEMAKALLIGPEQGLHEGLRVLEQLGTVDEGRALQAGADVVEGGQEAAHVGGGGLLTRPSLQEVQAGGHRLHDSLVLRQDLGQSKQNSKFLSIMPDILGGKNHRKLANKVLNV